MPVLWTTQTLVVKALADARPTHPRRASTYDPLDVGQRGDRG
jgi:hypothetical protein